MSLIGPCPSVGHLDSESWKFRVLLVLSSFRPPCAGCVPAIAAFSRRSSKASVSAEASACDDVTICLWSHWTFVSCESTLSILCRLASTPHRHMSWHCIRSTCTAGASDWSATVCPPISATTCQNVVSQSLSESRIFTSAKQPPPTSKTESRYLFLHEFVVSHSLHFTFDIVVCSSFLLTSIASSTAVLVTLCILRAMVVVVSLCSMYVLLWHRSWDRL